MKRSSLRFGSRIGAGLGLVLFGLGGWGMTRGWSFPQGTLGPQSSAVGGKQTTMKPERRASRARRPADANEKLTSPWLDSRYTRKSRREEMERRLAERFGLPWRDEEESHENGRYDEPGEAMEYYRLKRLPAGMREIPVERYFEARERMLRMPQHSTADNRLAPSRAELQSGPEQQRLGAWSPLGPGNIGGRTRAILVHPRTPEVIYAAGVAGGVWKSVNGGQMWAPVSDLIANIAVGAMAFDPKNPEVVFAGTGEGFFNGDGVRGAGIFRSNDGGMNWTRLAGTVDREDFHYVNDIVVSPNDSARIYAATRTGVWRTTDGGETWTQALGTQVLGGCLDLAVRTDKTTDYLFAACGTFEQSAVYRNSDAAGAGAWETTLTESGMGRTAIAIAPSNQNVVYAVASEVENAAYLDGLHAFFRSTASGDAGSWTARVRNTDEYDKLNTAILSIPPAAGATDCKTGDFDEFFGQAWFDLTIAVDPVDENRVWVGGIDLFRSDDGGANWGIAGFVYPINGASKIHPDQHTIVFHPRYDGAANQTMFVGNDGGVFKTENARARVATGPKAACDTANGAVQWTSLNNNYAVTQFYHGAVAPDGKSYFGGTQDNGTVRGADGEGQNAWREILGADGGYSHFDFLKPATLYASTQGAAFWKSTDNGASFSSANGSLNIPGLFITPSAMDPSDPDRLYTGGPLIFRTLNGMATWSRITGDLSQFPGTGLLSSIAVAPTDANRLAAGFSRGAVYTTTFALSGRPASGLQENDTLIGPREGFVSWAAFDPEDAGIIYATYSSFNTEGNEGHVFRSTNRGLSWTRIDGQGAAGIPDIPAHCIVIDPVNRGRYYVGTDLGVFVSTDFGATWAVENTGFANVPVESLSLQTVGGVNHLYAFTHGRGAYRVAIGPSGCAYTISPATRKIGRAGGEIVFNLSTSATSGGGACGWKAQSNAEWIELRSASAGGGDASIALKIQPWNGLGDRAGTVTIGGRSFSVIQEGLPDTEPPVVKITSPDKPVVDVTSGAIDLSGVASDNSGELLVTVRTDRGVRVVAEYEDGNWIAFGMPLLAGRNVIQVLAFDGAGNQSVPQTLTVNVAPASVFATAAGKPFLNSGYPDDGAPATATNLESIARIAFDDAGNLYICEYGGHRVRKVALDGTISTVAGTGERGYSGDGGPATQAKLNLPVGVAVDRNGDLYIAEFSNHTIRKVSAATGLITTIAGVGRAGFNGDGGPAKDARLNLPDGIALDAQGNLYIAERGNHRVRKVNASDGRISTIAGTGRAEFSGDGGPAREAGLNIPLDVRVDDGGNIYVSDGAIDRGGNIYLSDLDNGRVRRVDAATGVITTIAGGGGAFLAIDGMDALAARFVFLGGVAVDRAGSVFLAEPFSGSVLKIVPTLPGDVTPPVARITEPTTSASYVANSNPVILKGEARDNNVVVQMRWRNDRGKEDDAFRLSPGNGWSIPIVSLNNGVNNLTVTAWDANGNSASARLTVSHAPQQLITSVAGASLNGQDADDIPGLTARLSSPAGLVVDRAGAVIFADSGSHRVRRISPTGVISAFAGSGALGSSGDGGPATAASMNLPVGLAMDASGNLYISDALLHRVRKVTADGKITTVAGNGGAFGGFSGDGGPAVEASLNTPLQLAVDAAGNLYIADGGNSRIRKVNASDGRISTVAGTGLYNRIATDDIPATQADLGFPAGVAVDAMGNLYIADSAQQRIRRVNASDGKITTIAGTGQFGYNGDAIPAKSARLRLSQLSQLSFDPAGALVFADTFNERIRKITLGAGLITTIAGSGVTGFDGDGSSPGGAELNLPIRAAFDSQGNLYLTEAFNNRVRRTRPAAGLNALTATSAASFAAGGDLAPEMIAAIFGGALATDTAPATSLPLPYALAGSTARVRDNSGIERLAPLFFVSPNQINLLIPSGASTGQASITVANARGEIATGNVNIANVAPGLFSASANGQGIAAGVVLRIAADGRQSYEPVSRFDPAQNRVVLVPISLDVETDQVFLILFGTGFRFPNQVATAMVGGERAETLYAGSQDGLAGLDQVNIRLPLGLKGRGEADVALTVDGVQSNGVKVLIK